MPEFKLLTDGTLEIAARGTWRLIPGCSCEGIFEYAERMTELWELVQDSDGSKTLDALYQDDRRFRYLCDRVLELNGCKADWVRPADLDWLIFGWVAEDGTPQQSPLALLNTPPEPRHPRKAAPEDGPSDFIRLLAALASLPDTSLEDAVAAARALPARVALGVMEDRAWGSLSEEDKDDIRKRQMADKYREQFGKAA